jgi:hypothetical protein
MKTRYTFILLCSLTSCLQEELSPENYEFRGSWDSRKYAIQIFSNGSGTLDIRNRGRLEGNVRINGNKMTFISENETDGVGYKRFDIDQRPTTDNNGVTYIVLDGHRLEKQ